MADDTNYGHPIWAKYGKKWYPAKVVSQAMIQVVLQKKLKSIEGYIAIECDGEGKNVGKIMSPNRLRLSVPLQCGYL